jgi:diguanylate cyclase (GGDEF)-like protein
MLTRMSVFSLPDIAGMLVLMGVLGWFRNRQRDDRVDTWLLGLTFILVEMIASAIIRGSGLLPAITHVVALDAYLLAALTFGWAARRDLVAGSTYWRHFLLPAIPLCMLATLFGADVQTARLFIAIPAATLVVGLIYLLFFFRMRRRLVSVLVLIHLSTWLPMLYQGLRGERREEVYWGLSCLYLLVAFSFRRRARRGMIGPWVVMVAFVIWSMCFLVYPLAASRPYLDAVIEQVWNIQKFFVVIGMLLVQLEDETEQRRNEAMHDALTGLPNRRLFEDRLQMALARSRRTGAKVAVMAIDLNGFKEVNDTYGHQVGDRVLTSVAARLKRSVRGADTVARCGGDEFLVIVSDLARPESCERIAGILRSAIKSAEIPRLPGVRMSGSIGYAIFPDEATHPETLCQIADARMYDDKRLNGRESEQMGGPAS